MKPLDGTFADNALKHGVAGLNVDGGRIDMGTDYDSLQVQRQQAKGSATVKGAFGAESLVGTEIPTYNPKGRWPANVIHDGSDEVLAGMPETVSGSIGPHHAKGNEARSSFGMRFTTEKWQGDSGSAARFFYTAKVSPGEREAGLRGRIPCVKCGELDTATHLGDDGERVDCTRNSHPTLKPLALMEYLAKLTATPTGGVVLDPFMGSGTTGVACLRQGRRFIGIEQDRQSFDIAVARIEHELAQAGLFTGVMI